MKASITLLGLSLLFFSAGAQDWTETNFKHNNIYEGWYVKNTGDTVKGFFRYGYKAENQKKCDFYELDPASGQKKFKESFKPEDIKSFMVGDKLYRSIHYSGGLMAKPLRFCLVTHDGPICEYVFYSEGTAAEDKTVYHKAHDPNNNEPKELQYFGIGFAKKMAEYVSDYVELSKKIADKEKGYGMLKILDIIKEYNDWYLAQKK